jgi:putative ABC transport system ATP-binding protein
MSDPAPLSVSCLKKSYALGKTTLEVLHGVDLEIPRGELCCVMGPSGVGKSTLLSCVAGLEQPDTGTIDVLGQDVATLSDKQRTILRRKTIGIIYQFFNLVENLSAFENVALPFLIDGIKPPKGVVEGALERVGMRQREKHRPAQLSGGEMQLVSIARALVREPALVLADEPTGNVNVATGRRIMQILKDVVRQAGSAMLMVTHNPDDAACADRVVFMQDGRIQDQATLGGNDVSKANVFARLSELGI